MAMNLHTEAVDSPFLSALRAEEQLDLAQVLFQSMDDYAGEWKKAAEEVSSEEGIARCVYWVEGMVGVEVDSWKQFLSQKPPALLFDARKRLLAILVEEKDRRSEPLSLAQLEDWADNLASDSEEVLFRHVAAHYHRVECWEDFPFIEQDLSETLFHRWRAVGVRIDTPHLVRISPDVVLGRGTWIRGSVEITQGSVIGERCEILGPSRIRDSVIGAGVRIESSVVESSVMEEGSNIGPYSHLRPKAHLRKGVHIGNFVEVKNATLGERTKAGHLAYIGDADVGAEVNIGCGAIFVNYDGAFKHRSTVEDGAFVGSNANLVAPVHVNKEGFIAAGSTITDAVGAGELAIARARQVNRPGYVEEKKQRDQKTKEAEKREGNS